MNKKKKNGKKEENMSLIYGKTEFRTIDNTSKNIAKKLSKFKNSSSLKRVFKIIKIWFWEYLRKSNRNWKILNKTSLNLNEIDSKFWNSWNHKELNPKHCKMLLKWSRIMRTNKTNSLKNKNKRSKKNYKKWLHLFKYSIPFYLLIMCVG